MDINVNQNTSLRTVNEGMGASIRDQFESDAEQEKMMQSLSDKLMEMGRQEDAQRAICDEDYRMALLDEFHISSKAD